MSYIGMAAAIGKPVDIPIILRVLAGHLNHTPDGSTILTDYDFIQSLNAGSVANDLSPVADTYLHDWWNSSECPPDEDLLGYVTLEEALEHHRVSTGLDKLQPVENNKKIYTWSRHISGDPRNLTIDCNRCRLYRGVALGLNDNLQDIRHHIHGIMASSEYQADTSERRAAGFFQLYEEALLKESSSYDISGSSKREKGRSKDTTTRRANDVMKIAAGELSRLEDLPALKWTWGPELTEKDVTKLERPIVPNLGRVHSGYEKSLPWGQRNDDSTNPSSPATSPVLSDIASSNSAISLLSSADIPTHFNYFPLRQEVGFESSLHIPRSASHSSIDGRPIIRNPFIGDPRPSVIKDHVPSSPGNEDNTSVIPAANVYSEDNSINSAKADIVSDTNSSNAVEAGHVYTDTENETDSNLPLAADVYPESDSDSAGVAQSDVVPADVYPDSDSDTPNAADIYTDSDSEIPAAGEVFTDSDFEIPVAGDVYPDSDSETSVAGNVYSDTVSEAPAAGHVYTDSDSDIPDAGDVFSDTDTEIAAAEVFTWLRYH
jgi:hypothetical protein